VTREKLRELIDSQQGCLEERCGPVEHQAEEFAVERERELGEPVSL
jgi:hypothetical protein